MKFCEIYIELYNISLEVVDKLKLSFKNGGKNYGNHVNTT